MSETLQVHRASQTERIEAYRNVHEFWGRGLAQDEYVEGRLKSIKHNQAEWYVGSLDGKVVTSLGCYPLQFRLHEETLAGIGLGAVHTLPTCRGRGFAPQLIRFVEDVQHEAGAGLSLLYSDIKPSYYAALGYRECPSWSGWCEIARPSDRGGQRCRLERCSIPSEQQALVELYDDYHAKLSFSIARSPEYWRHLISREPHDEFYWLVSPNSQHVGYVRLRPDEDQILVRDLALADHSDEMMAELCDALQSHAAEQSAARVGGWLPDVPGVRGAFALSARPNEITMIKLLGKSTVVSDIDLAAAQHFHEIDHV